MTTYMALFLSDSKNLFYMFSTIYPYLSLPLFILCLYFRLSLPSRFFLTLLAVRRILQFTMFDSLQPSGNIAEIKHTSYIRHDERKGVALIITNSNALI